jgi:hypothetical protein
VAGVFQHPYLLFYLRIFLSSHQANKKGSGSGFWRRVFAVCSTLATEQAIILILISFLLLHIGMWWTDSWLNVLVGGGGLSPFLFSLFFQQFLHDTGHLTTFLLSQSLSLSLSLSLSVSVWLFSQSSPLFSCCCGSRRLPAWLSSSNLGCLGLSVFCIFAFDNGLPAAPRGWQSHK